MKAPTDVQIIQQAGQPAFAVLPYAQYLELVGAGDDDSTYIPHEVVGLCIEKELSLIAAWRVYKKFTQSELAERMGVSQPALAQIEKLGARPQKRTLEKAAAALGVSVAQLSE